MIYTSPAQIKLIRGASAGFLEVAEVKPRSAEGVLILGHGYNSNKDSLRNIRLEEILMGEGVATVRADMPGHGESYGEIELLTPREFIDAWKTLILNYMRRELGVGVHGNSFSSYPLLNAVADGEYELACMGFMAPASDLSHFDHPIVAESELFPIYDRIENIPRNIPVMIVHGEGDKVIPVSQSRELEARFRNNGNPVALHEIPDAGHGCQEVGEYVNGLFAEFYSNHLGQHKVL